MQNINFDSGMIELAIQGDESRVLRFNPESTNFIEGFSLMIDKFNTKLPEFQAKAEAHDNSVSQMSEIERSRERVEIQKEIDQFIYAEIDEIFGQGSSDVIFADASPSAKTSTGGYVASNFLNAMVPIIKSEMLKRNSKVQDLVRDHKRKAGTR